jgi:hypothetical protein
LEQGNVPSGDNDNDDDDKHVPPAKFGKKKTRYTEDDVCGETVFN